MAEGDNTDCSVKNMTEEESTDSQNERLLRILFSRYNNVMNVMIDKSIPRSLSDSKCDIDSNVKFKSTDFPQLDQHKYDYSLLHSNSPTKPSSLHTHFPPIGVFWDIQNCRIPKGKLPMAVINIIRDKFFTYYREAEFIVVCDVYQETKRVIKQLNDAQVNLIHVAATCKNAADEKLKQSIRRFADIHGSPAAILLISNDIHFAADLSDLRYRKKIHVILLHTKHISKALLLCANEHYDFSKLMKSLPSRKVEVNYKTIIFFFQAAFFIILVYSKLLHTFIILKY